MWRMRVPAAACAREEQGPCQGKTTWAILDRLFRQEGGNRSFDQLHSGASRAHAYARPRPRATRICICTTAPRKTTTGRAIGYSPWFFTYVTRKPLGSRCHHVAHFGSLWLSWHNLLSGFGSSWHNLLSARTQGGGPVLSPNMAPREQARLRARNWPLQRVSQTKRLLGQLGALVDPGATSSDGGPCPGRPSALPARRTWTLHSTGWPTRAGRIHAIST